MPSDSALILAIDVGTSSTRTALFDARGDRLTGTTAQRSYPLLTTADGGAELDPAALEDATTQCLRETLEHRRAHHALKDRPIAGIGVSCFWHSFIGTDAHGEPLTRVVTWADSRCREDAALLRQELGEKAVHARTGCMVRASFWPAKLVWLQRAQRQLFRKVRRWLSPAEWLQLRLAGAANCAIGMATGTGLFQPARLTWDAALLQRCGLAPEQLGAVDDAPTETAGRIGEQFPELRGVPWFPAIGDGAASNLGSGATRPGLAAINVGTSAALRVMRVGQKEARAPFGLFCYRVDAERYLVGGAVSNAGNLRAWCLRELRLEEDAAAMEEQLARRPAPAHGLTVLPFWTAERAPTWNEEQPGVIVGLTQHTTALDLLQATTEGSYHRLARIAELLLANVSENPKFLVSGGIQNSRVAMQRLADVLGQRIHASPEPEASLRGAAVFAGEKLGLRLAELKAGRPIRPQPKIAAQYAREREKQIALEELLRHSRE
jgi:gluconokinase